MEAVGAKIQRSKVAKMIAAGRSLSDGTWGGAASAGDGGGEQSVETQTDTFTVWLRTVLGEQEMSATTLARRMGRPALTVQGWLLGTTRPTPSEIAAIADAIGITISRASASL
jgi:hypothetical protein